MRKIVFLQEARRELDEAGDWYEQERIGLGFDFFAEIERLLHRVSGNPDQFPILYRGTRKALHADSLTVKFVQAFVCTCPCSCALWVCGGKLERGRRAWRVS